MSFSSFKIANIKIEPALVLAPMSGVTSSPLRRLIREANPRSVGLLVSEFVSVEGMTRLGRRSLEMMRFHEEERPFCIQIFGHDINRMRDAALMVQDAGADILDINCGCPAPKVVRKGGGCELMRQPHHLAKILREIKRHLTIPLTMKIRAGWDENSRNALEIARIGESEGIDALYLHARTRAQLYRGEGDWQLTDMVASSLKIPVLGSGDVTDRQSAMRRMEETAVSGLLIGRGALCNPWIFSEVAQGRAALENQPEAERMMLNLISRYMELLLCDFSHSTAIGKVKQLVSQIGKAGAGRAFEWRKPLCRASSLSQQKEILDEHLLRFAKTTELSAVQAT